MTVIADVSHSPSCPSLAIGGSAGAPCLCIRRPDFEAPPKPPVRTGLALTGASFGAGHFRDRVESVANLRETLRDRGLEWADVVKWASRQRLNGRPRWSRAELKAFNVVVVEAFLAYRNRETSGGEVSARMARARSAGLAAARAAKATAPKLIEKYDLDWEVVRMWGRTEGGISCDHTKPARPSLKCVKAYLEAHPDVVPVGDAA